jgi:hypothetical protein
MDHLSSMKQRLISVSSGDSRIGFETKAPCARVPPITGSNRRPTLPLKSGIGVEPALSPDVRDVESDQFDIGTTSIKLVRVGNVLQILFSSPLEAEYLNRELVERYKRAEERLKSE